MIESDEIAAQVWVQLQRACVDRHHEWRTPVLASIGLDGSAQARTVVLRRANIGEWRLLFYTDRRSPKVSELRAHPAATLVFWSRRLSWQIRAQVATQVLDVGPLVDSAWATVEQSPAAADYLSSEPPGAEWPAPSDPPGALESPCPPVAPSVAPAVAPAVALTTGPRVGGSGPPGHDASPQRHHHHLAVVVADVLSIDWLELSRAGHRRARLTMRGLQWLVP